MTTAYECHIINNAVFVKLYLDESGACALC